MMEHRRDITLYEYPRYWHTVRNFIKTMEKLINTDIAKIGITHKSGDLGPCWELYWETKS